MSAPLTFLFTDQEYSTSLWERAPEAMREALATHIAHQSHGPWEACEEELGLRWSADTDGIDN